jgi:hypothetical protein
MIATLPAFPSSSGTWVDNNIYLMAILVSGMYIKPLKHPKQEEE